MKDLKKIVIATSNQHKVIEIRELCRSWNVEFLSLNDIGLGELEIVEDGSTYIENAQIKAKEVKKYTDYPVIADDSGLSIDALNGEPGLYTARFLSELTFRERKAKVIEMLKDRERGAHFTCALCFIDRDIINVQSEVYGTISYEDTGINGFGYDGIFYLKEYDQTYAQMSQELKNEVSHRGRAIRKMEEKLREINFL